MKTGHRIRLREHSNPRISTPLHWMRTVLLCTSLLLCSVWTTPGVKADTTTSWPLPHDAVDVPSNIRTPDSQPGDTVVPYCIRKVALGDVSLYAKGGLQADTCVSFSPDSRLIAAGTFLGDIRVLDIYSGKVLWGKKIPEGMVKKIVFSRDGKTVIYGEQSPDGFVYAAETKTGKEIWRFRLANDLESSAPPEKGDVWGIYKLPGCHRLIALDNGDVLVLGIHAWGDWAEGGSIARRSRIYRLTSDGQLRWAFPAQGAARLSFPYIDADPAGDRIAVLIGEGSHDKSKTNPLIDGSLYCLDGKTGLEIGHYQFEPLKPYFDKVFFWHSVSVAPDGRRISIGLGDGRAFIMDAETVVPLYKYDFGTPIQIGDLPVSAFTTYTHIASDRTVYFQTGNSNVPSGAGAGQMTQPPGPHPNAHTIHAVGEDGTILWRFRSGAQHQNFWTSADGRWVFSSTQKDNPQTGRSAGAVLFDTTRPGGGREKFVYYYPIEGRSFFQADCSPDGAVLALVETPYQDSETGQIIGSYRLHLIR